MLVQNLYETHGYPAAEIRWELTKDDVLRDARNDVEMGTVDGDRVAKCPVYRSAVLAAYKSTVEVQSNLIDSLRKTIPATASFSWGYTGNSAGNSSWAADAGDRF